MVERHRELETGRQKELDEGKAISDTIFNNSSAACVITDRNWKWIKVNPAFENLSGYSAKEILGKFDYEMPFWSSQEIMRIREHISDKKPGEPIQLETFIKGRYGDHIHLLINAIYVEEEVSERVGWIGYLTDIGELRRREEGINDVKTYLEGIIASVPNSLCVMDTEGKWFLVNTAMTKLTGYSEEELLDRRIEDQSLYLLPEAKQANAKMNNELKTYGAVTGVEIPWQRKDGQKIIVSASQQYLRDTKGDIIGSVLIARDISEAKKVAAEIAKVVATVSGDSLNEERGVSDLAGALKKMGESIHRSIDALDALTGETNDASGGLFLNPKPRRLLTEGMDTTTNHISSRVAEIAQRVADETKHIEEARRAMADLRLLNGEDGLGMRAASNIIFNPVESASTIKNLEGAVQEFEVAVKLLENAFLQADREAGKIEEVERSNFINTLAHELKSPLTSIVSSSELLPEALGNQGVALRLAQIIYRASQEMNERTSELLDTIKARRNGFELELEELDLKSLIMEVASSFEPQTRSK
jgi:PAS domain S-box-containing protein